MITCFSTKYISSSLGEHTTIKQSHGYENRGHLQKQAQAWRLRDTLMKWNSTFQPLGESVPKDEERSQRVSLATWQWPSECIPSHYTESQTYRQRSRVIKTLDLLLRWLWAVILLFSLSMLICKTDVASSLNCCEDSTKQIWNTWHKGGIKYVFNKRWLLLLLPPYPQIMLWQEAHRALLSLCS